MGTDTIVYFHPMRAGDIFQLARNAMRSNRLRSNLTVAIIAIGITALMGIATVIEVLKGTIHSNFSGMGSNTFTITAESIVGKKGRRGGGNNTERRIRLSEAMEFRDSYHYPGIVSISLLCNSMATVRHNKLQTNPNVMVMGCDEWYVRLSETNVLYGRNFSNGDANSNVNTCLLGHSIAKKLFPDLSNAASNTVMINDQRYTVLGVLESKGSSMVNRTDNMVFISLANARQRYNVTEKTAVISIAVNDLKHMGLAMEEAEGTMRAIKRLGAGEADNFSLNKNDEIANTLIQNISFVTIAAGLIGFITLLGAAISLMNIMLVAVAERTREIGINKAIGANSSSIKKQFLLEAIYISVKGGLIGMTIGILLGNVLAIFFNSGFVLPWFWMGLGLGICFLVGMGAGIYPAIRASNLNPINALRYE